MHACMLDARSSMIMYVNVGAYLTSHVLYECLYACKLAA